MTGLKISSLLVLLTLSGCAWLEPQPVVIDTGCQVFRPIIIPVEDVPYVREGMTDLLVDQLVNHNEAGRRLCGW